MAGAAEPAWLAWLETTWLAELLRREPWLFPLVEVLHILGFVILVGAAVMFDLRLLGLSRRLPVTGLARHLLPWARGSVTVVVLTGVLLLLPQATHLGMSPLFRLKLTLLTLAGLNATLFHLGVFRSVQAWDTDAPAPPLARASAIASLLLWAGVITCGRLLAYF